jgi:hypothetical protein
MALDDNPQDYIADEQYRITKLSPSPQSVVILDPAAGFGPWAACGKPFPGAGQCFGRVTGKPEVELRSRTVVNLSEDVPSCGRRKPQTKMQPVIPTCDLYL